MISIKTDEDTPKTGRLKIASKEVLRNRLKQFMEEARTRLQDPDDCFVGLDQIKAGIQNNRSIPIIPAASSHPRKAVSQIR